MGKILIEYWIPALFLVFLAWKLVKLWYFYFFSERIKTFGKLKKAGDKYDKQMEKTIE